MAHARDGALLLRAPQVHHVVKAGGRQHLAAVAEDGAADGGLALESAERLVGPKVGRLLALKPDGLNVPQRQAAGNLKGGKQEVGARI